MRSRLIVNLFVAFYLFGAAMCLLTIVILAFPGSAFDALWRVNPEARRGFLSIGPWAFVIMAIAGTACALSAVGLMRRQEWGRRLAIAVLAVNLAGDTAGAVVRRDPRTLIGLPIAGAMIALLVKVELAPHE